MPPHDALRNQDRLRAVRAAMAAAGTARVGLDILARTAAAALNARSAVVALVDARQELLVGLHGISGPPAAARRLPHAFAGYVVRTSGSIVVADIRRDHRMAADEGVRGLGAVACAAIPLRVPSGEVLGAFCAIEPSPRNWTARDVEVAEGFAALAIALLSLRHAPGEDDESPQRREDHGSGELAARVIHDFNNILMGLRIQLELLKDDTSPCPRISAIGEALEEGARVTSRLMATAQTRRQIPEAVRPDEILAASASALRDLAAPRRLAISTPGAGAAVLAPAGRIEELLLHLVAAARDVTPGHGTITVRTAPIALHGSGGILPPPPGRHVAIVAENTGPELAAGVRRQVVEPFLEAPRRSAPMGLAAVFEIVRALEGGFDLSSEPGRTAFTAYVPEAPAADTIRCGPRDAPAYPTVLLVDDDTNVRTLIARQLSREGIRVATAANASEALAAARQEEAPFGAVVADVNLPQVSGVTLAGQLVAEVPCLRVVLMSGNATRVDTTAVPAANLAGVLQKPFDIGELLAALRTSAPQELGPDGASAR